MPNQKQHYIPYFLLNQFRDENGFFSVYSIPKNQLLEKQNPRNFAHMRYMYDLSELDLRDVLAFYIQIDPETEKKIDFSDNKFIEKYFSRVEPYIGNLFQRILMHDHLVLSLEDKLGLLLFFHDLAFRTKFYRDISRTIAEKTNQMIEDISLAQGLDKSKYENYLFKDTNKYEMSKIFDIKSYVNFVNLILNEYDFCYAINNSHFDFILSDNPCFKLKAGINDFCFPISNKRAIILRHKRADQHRICSIPNGKFVMKLSTDSIIEYNHFNAMQSHEYIFGTKKSIDFISKITQFGYFTFD